MREWIFSNSVPGSGFRGSITYTSLTSLIFNKCGIGLFHPLGIHPSAARANVKYLQTAGRKSPIETLNPITSYYFDISL